MDEKNSKWNHPGGKLVELGPSSLTDEELLSILIGSGYKGRSAQDIAKDLLDNYYSIPGLMGKKLTDLSKIKGLKDVKVVRIAAAFEIARRVVKALEKE
jgi:DNA repair protein RadC